MTKEDILKEYQEFLEEKRKKGKGEILTFGGSEYSEIFKSEFLKQDSKILRIWISDQAHWKSSYQVIKDSISLFPNREIRILSASGLSINDPIFQAKVLNLSVNPESKELLACFNQGDPCNFWVTENSYFMEYEPKVPKGIGAFGSIDDSCEKLINTFDTLWNMKNLSYEDLLAKYQEDKKKIQDLIDQEHHIKDELGRLRQERSEIEDILNERSSLVINPGDVLTCDNEYDVEWIFVGEQDPLRKPYYRCLVITLRKDHTNYSVDEMHKKIRKDLCQKRTEAEFEEALSAFMEDSKMIINENKPTKKA
jgi:hypothetical protein